MCKIFFLILETHVCKLDRKKIKQHVIKKDVKEYSFKVQFSIIVMHNNTDHINFIFSLNVGFRIRWFSIV